MASLIWEPVGFISTGDIKLRVKMNDGSNMSDSAEASDFISTINGDPYKTVAFDSAKWSLGFGVQNFNYTEDFWIPASQVTGSGEGNFSSLGEGIGVEVDAQNLLPYYYSISKYDFNNNSMKVGNYVKATSFHWEVANYSAIITLSLSSKWGSQINASGGQDVNTTSYFYTNNFPEIWGDAPFLNYQWNEQNSINSSDIDGYNILFSTKLYIVNTETENAINLNPIECAESNAITNSINSANRNAYAPIDFIENIPELRVAISDLDSPSFVNEAESAPMRLQLYSSGYNGDVKVFLLDSESLNSINEEIGGDLAEFGYFISEDIVAQYGLLDSDGSKVITKTISDNEILDIDVNYQANNVDGGQTDNFSIFVQAKNLNVNEYSFEGVEYLYSLLSEAEHYDYTDNREITILDTDEEYIEEYNPSSNLIVRPSDIIYHLLDTELDYNESVDAVSLRESRNNHFDWEMGFSVSKSIDSKKLIQEIAKSSKLVPTLNNNLLKFINIQDTYTGEEDILTINSDEVIKYSFSRTPIEDVKTEVEVKYKKDYGLDSYLESTEKLKVNTNYLQNSYFTTGTYGDYVAETIDNNNYYGVKYDEVNKRIEHIDTFMTFESDYIRNQETANLLAQYLLLWNCNQHNIIDITLPLKYYSYEVGDLIEFDKMILGKKIYGENYVVDNPEDMPIRCGQYILPLFMITETNKGLNSIKIKAMQLHHMSVSNLNYKGNSYPQTDLELGDVNNDGELDVLDVVSITSHIAGNTTLTGNALKMADYNQDGFVDVLDLVAMINRIVNE